MNKLLTTTAVILLLCSCGHTEEFKNPVFEKTLLPYSDNAQQTHLTPNKRVVGKGAKVDYSDCQLIENTEDAITLKCYHYNKEEPVIYRYVVQPKKQYKAGRHNKYIAPVVDKPIEYLEPSPYFGG